MPKRGSSKDRSDCTEYPEEGAVAAAGDTSAVDVGLDEEGFGPDAGVELFPVDSSESSLEDFVLGSIVYPKRSVVGGGNVVISAAGTVISVKETAPLAVSTHRHIGVSVTTQSPTVVPSICDALS